MKWDAGEVPFDLPARSNVSTAGPARSRCGGHCSALHRSRQSIGCIRVASPSERWDNRRGEPTKPRAPAWPWPAPRTGPGARQQATAGRVVLCGPRGTSRCRGPAR